MTKQLLRTLFTTFIISVILDIAVTCIYFAITQRHSSFDYMAILKMVSFGAFFLNIILFIMVLPVLFFSLPHIRSNFTMRIILYFAGPIVFLITATVMQVSPLNKLFYLSTGIIFIIVHSVLYFKSIKKIV